MGRKRLNYCLVLSLFFCTLAFAGEKVTGSFHVNGLNNINWTDTHNIGGTNVNWSDIRSYATSFGGDHSGINWQSLGV